MIKKIPIYRLYIPVLSEEKAINNRDAQESNMIMILVKLFLLLYFVQDYFDSYQSVFIMDGDGDDIFIQFF